MKNDAKYQNQKYHYNGKIVKKIEFDFKDTLYGVKDGKVIIKGVRIPGPGEFKLNETDSKDNKLYATKSGIDFIMMNVPAEILQEMRNANVASD